MLRQALVAAAFALALVGSAAHADGAPRTISVTGYGEVSASPDIAHVIVGVRTMAESARTALAENSATMTTVFDVLRNAGIASRDMRTTGLSLNPRWAPEVREDGTRGQVLTGYEASNQLHVTCRDLSRLGALLDELAEAGANELRGITFDIDDKDRLMDEARALAVADGRAKAALLAREAGVELGTVLSISDTAARGPVVTGRAMSEMAMQAVPIAEGEQTISATLSLSFEIE